LEKNDIWPKPYIGSRYNFKTDGIYYRIPEVGIKIKAKKWNQDLLKDLFDVNPEPNGGSFKVNENGEVITKVKTGNGWIPYYVGQYDIDIKFNGIELNPGPELKPGDLWPGLYYLHGSMYSFSFYKDEIFCKRNNKQRYYSISNNMDLIQKLRKYRPDGGRFYINEHKKVWVNSKHLPNEHSIESQVRNFSSMQKYLLDQRIEATGCFPVFVCNYTKPIKLDLDGFTPDYSIENL